MAAISVVVIIVTLIVAHLVATDQPENAENLQALAGVLFSLALFTIVVASWPQLLIMVLWTVVSVVVINVADVDTTLLVLINFILTALTAFVGSGVRTIFK